MRKVNQKVVSIFLMCILVLISITWNAQVEAASVTMNASATTVTVGDKVTITVNATAGSWNLAINGGGLTAQDSSGLVGQTNTTSNANASKSYVFSTSKAGTYTITLTGDITDYDTDTNTKINKTVTITVKEKETTPPDNNNNGGNNNNSNGNNNKPVDETLTFTSVNETVYATGDINVRKSYTTSSSIVGTLKKGEAVTRTGKGSNGWSKVSYKGTTAYISSSLLTTTKPEEEKKSSNAALKSLKVDQEGLTPEFSKDIENYVLNVPSTVENLKVTAEPEDAKATVKIIGNEGLKEGDNKVTITVTAEDGSIKTYLLTVTKGVENTQTLGLQSLTIKGVDFADVFKPDVYEYTIEVKEDISKLEIEAVANDENATVEITGNEDLEDGENVITILVKSADGENVVTYQITVNKTKQTEVVAETTNKIDIVLIVVIVAAVLLVILIIVLFIRRRKQMQMDDDGYYPDDEEENTNWTTSNFEEDNKNAYFEDNKINQDIYRNDDDDDNDDDRPKRGRGKHF